jgi:hypothetical protein
MQPPWSTATSTITLPGFIALSISRVTRCGARARDQHRADKQVGPRHHLGDIRGVRRERLHPPAEDVVEVLQPVVADVEDGDARAEAERDLRGVGADHAAAQNHHLARLHARHTADQEPAPAQELPQVVRAHLRRHAARHLAHRREQRQVAVLELHRLVRHRGGAGLKQPLGERPVRGEVQLGKEQQVFPQESLLLPDRLLDLQDHLLRPRLLGAAGDAGALRLVFRVAGAAARDETLLVYLTDGRGRFPEAPPEQPVLWLVPPGGLDAAAFPFGEVIRLVSS